MRSLVSISGLCVLALSLTACAHPQAVDEEKLIERVTERVLARIAARGEGEAPARGLDANVDLRRELGTAARMRVPVEGAPARGAAHPLVTIVEFADLQCPFCARADETMSQVLRDFPNEVRIVFRHQPLPFHQNAMPAAQAAIAVRTLGGDDAFFRFITMAYENNRALDLADLTRYARELGLDGDRVARAIGTNEFRGQVAADVALATRVGADGTPTFFINGRVVDGAQDYEVFRRIIVEEIAIARSLLAHGAPVDGLYDQMLTYADEAAEAAPPPAEVLRADDTPSADAIHHVEVAGHPQQGPANAPVTIVVFSDFECPFCSRAAETIREVQERYGTAVRYVFRHNPLPFHDHAMAAAEAAEEARAQRGDSAFFTMHDLLFANQRTLEPADLERYAREAHLDLRRFRAAMADHRHRPTIEADVNESHRHGAGGTPTFFINGRMLVGAQPLDAFVALIDTVKTEAEARIAAGTPASQIYADVTAGGRAPDAAPQAPLIDPVYELAVPPAAPTRGGGPGAPIVIQELGDFQCPFCQRAESTIAQVLERYGNRVRFVWRDEPLAFHEHAMPAAEAAREVLAQRGNAAFWQFHDLLFANRTELELEDLLRYAGQVRGVNVARVRTALERGTHRAAVQADLDAIERLGIPTGTPSFLINGHLLRGAQPVEQFVRVIDGLLAAPPVP